MEEKQSRREFLKRLAALSATAIASPLFVGGKLEAMEARGYMSLLASGTCGGGMGCAGGGGSCGGGMGCAGGGSRCGSSYSCSGSGVCGGGMNCAGS